VSTYPLVDTNLGAHQGHHSYPSTPRPDGPGMTLTKKLLPVRFWEQNLLGLAGGPRM